MPGFVDRCGVLGFVRPISPSIYSFGERGASSSSCVRHVAAHAIGVDFSCQRERCRPKGPEDPVLMEDISALAGAFRPAADTPISLRHLSRQPVHSATGVERRVWETQVTVRLRQALKKRQQDSSTVASSPRTPFQELLLRAGPQALIVLAVQTLAALSSAPLWAVNHQGQSNLPECTDTRRLTAQRLVAIPVPRTLNDVPTPTRRTE